MPATIRQDRPGDRTATSRAGFTLVELLVVLAIVGLLLSLALPAVLSARDSANRAACASNLRQIGVALASFETVNGRYPKNFCGGSDEGTQCISALARLLPHLGQGELYDTIDWKDETPDVAPDPLYDGTNTTAMTTAVRVFLCPADGRAQGPKTSYRLCQGIYPRWPLHSEGFFSVFTRGQQTLVTDGLGHTAFASERLVGAGPGFDDLTRNAINIPRSWAAAAAEYGSDLEPPCLVANVESSPGLSEDGLLGWSWFRAGERHVAYYHTFPPNSRFRDCVSRNEALMTARSRHGAGVNVLFGDGRVTFIGNAIDFEVWRAMATFRRNDELAAQY